MSNDRPSLDQIDKMCAEVIVEVMDAARLPSTVGADRLYNDLCAKFDAVIRLYEVERVSDDAALELLYPLAAIADEMIMAIPQYRARWIANPLQLRYFNEVTTGTSFFTRLEKLMNEPEGHKRQLEIYFACLALGFKGMYSVGGQGGLRSIFEKLGAILAGMHSSGRGAQIFVSRKKKNLSLRRCLLAAFALLMVMVSAVYLSSLADFLKYLERSL